MAINEKASNALKSASTHLENSILALNKKDEDSFADGLWHVAAELEYALFLLSIKLPNEDQLSSWKPKPELKKTEIASMLADLKNLLGESEKFAVNERLEDAYRSAYVAKHYVLKVQGAFAKKKSEMFKKK